MIVSTEDQPSQLDRARAGDGGAFRGLIEPHRQALHAHCYRMLGSLHDADDAVQNTLLRAWQALPEFRGRSSLRTWLYRIATNVCLNAIAGRRKRIVPIDVARATSPSGAREKRVAARMQRAVLILRDVLGFSAKEAAESLETTVASVNGALLRARRAVNNRRLLERSEQASLGAIGDRRLREVVERFADALERGEIDSILALLGEEAPGRLPGAGRWTRNADTRRSPDDGHSQHRHAPRVRRRHQVKPTAARAHGGPQPDHVVDDGLAGGVLGR